MLGRAKVNRESQPGNSVRAGGPTRGKKCACQFLPKRLERKKSVDFQKSVPSPGTPQGGKAGGERQEEPG